MAVAAGRAPPRALPGRRRPGGRARRMARSPSTAPPAAFLDWALDSRPRAGDPGGAPLRRCAGLAPPPGERARRAGAALGARGRVRASDRRRRHRGRGAAGRLRRERGAARSRVARALGRARPRATAPREVLRGLDLRVEPRRAGRADGAKRRRQEHAAARRRRAASSRARGQGRGARAACALLPQSPGDLLVRERVGDELPGDAGRGRARAPSGSTGRSTPTRATSRAASASGWRWRSRWRAAAGGERCRAWSASTSRPGAWTAPARTSSPSWLGELAGARARRSLVATHDVEFAATLRRARGAARARAR